MTLRIPKPNTGSAWSRHYWTPPEHPEVPLLLSLAPATRRWLFTVPGEGVGFCWILSRFPRTDTAAGWEVENRSLALARAARAFGARPPLPDDADVDRVLWLPTNPWAALEALHVFLAGGPWLDSYGTDEVVLKKCPKFSAEGEHVGFTYAANIRTAWSEGTTAIEAVLRLADRVVGKKGGS